MKTQDFDYDLAQEFIAKEPCYPRDHCKLMCVDTSGREVDSRKFFEIEDLLVAGDVLVLNRSKVVPARIIFDFDGKECELFVLKKLDATHYQVMVRPGNLFSFGAQLDVSENLSFFVTEVLDDGTRVVEFFSFVDHLDIDLELKQIGEVPLPPYIKDSKASFDDYQTVYAQEEGSVAAPTAGLHFTEDLLDRIRKKGVVIEELVLHVGRGTFLPVKAEDIVDHVMHEEEYMMSESTANALNQAKDEGRRVIAVGTTVVRVLESCFDGGRFVPKCDNTNIFIYPGYKWKAVDALVTNFHLPKSTLLMLVSSFLQNKGYEDPVPALLELYESAKKEKYRFFSFGDAMFIY